MRISIAAVAIALSIVGLTVAADADAAIKKFTNIPAQELGSALQALARERSFQVVYRSEIVGKTYTQGAVGELTADEALTQLLSGTGLTFKYLDEKTVTIYPTASRARITATDTGPNAAVPARGTGAATSAQAFAGAGADTDSSSSRGFWSRFRLAQSATTSPGGATARQVDDKEAGREVPYIEEVIVTAQKRTENLQDVPIAISAFTGAALEQRGVESFEDLQLFVPGLNIGTVNRDMGIVTLRGVGLSNEVLGGDPGVTLYMNGHYLQSASFLLQDFLDVERVEVARGPQGTLYGRNSIGGVMNVVTKRPTEQLEGAFSVDLGNYNRRLLMGAISGPLSDRVRGRIAASRERRDGYVDNDSGPDVKTSDYVSTRAALEVDLTENLLMAVGGYYFDDTGRTFVRQFLFDPSTRRVSQNGPFERDSRAKGASLDFSWKLGSVELRSLSAFNDSNYFVHQDFDSGAVASTLLQQIGATETYTQELQLLSAPDGPLRWVTGAFYYKERSDFTFRVNALPTLDVRLGPALLHSESQALFGQIDYAFNDKWSGVFGLRYSKDKKDSTSAALYFASNGVVILPGGSAPTEFGDWDAWTGQIGVNYHLNADMMLYASYSRGYRTGGFNPGIAQFPYYKPEYVNSIELGLKSEWLDRRLQTNVAIFDYDYEDKQDNITVPVSTPNGPVNNLTFLSNATDVSIRGIEVETAVQPTRAFRLNVSLGYLDSKYLAFSVIDPSNPGAGLVNVSGNTLARSPKFKYSLGAEYRFELGTRGSVTPRIDYSWTDKVQFSYFERPRDWISSYDRVNARVQWQSASAKWSVELYGQNLEDEMTVANAVPAASGNNEVFYLAPRTYGFKVRYGF